MRTLSATGLCLLLLLCACTTANQRAIFRRSTIVDTDGARVDFVVTDARSRGRTIVTRDGIRTETKAADGAWTSTTSAPTIFTCTDAPPDVYALIGESLSVAAAYGKSATGPEASAQVAHALNESGGQLQRAAALRQLDAINESVCNMVQDGALSPDEYYLHLLINQRAIVAMSSVDAIAGMASPSRPPDTVVATAPSLSSDVDTLVEQGKTSEKDAQAADAAAKALADALGDKTKCDQLADDKKKACSDLSAAATKAQNKANASKAQLEALQKAVGVSLKSTASASSAPSPSPVQKEIGVAAVEAIQAITMEAMNYHVDDLLNLFCAPDLSADRCRERSGSGEAKAGIGVPTASAKSLATKLENLPASVNKRLYIQVATEDQRDAGNGLVFALKKRFGSTMAVGSVEVRRGPKVATLRYYDHGYDSAAQELAGILSAALSANVTTSYWRGHVTDDPAPGLFELWIPANLSISASKLPL